jgi:hypothetical protein
MRERPRTIQRLYEEFEKYCRSDNDFRMCMEEQSQQKKSAKANQSSEREWSNPRNASHANPRSILALTARMPRRIPIHRLTPKAWSLARLVHHIRIKWASAEAEEAAARAELTAGAEAIMRKENGTTSSIRRMMTIAQITVQTRKDLRPSLRRIGRKRRELAPSATLLQRGKTLASGETLSLTLFSHLSSSHLPKPIPNLHLRNHKLSKLRISSADPLSSTPSLLCSLLSKAHQLRQCQRSLRVKTILYHLSEP